MYMNHEKVTSLFTDCDVKSEVGKYILGGFRNEADNTVCQ